jgi:cell cycle serine/threonine-protein kinase CDC5/MSD2
MLRHPNIVEFYCSFNNNQNSYLVLGCCENKTLLDLAQNRKHLTTFEVRPLAIQMFGAVKHIHSAGVVHGDLSLKNVFLDVNMNIKVGDFGLATMLRRGERSFRRCGTPGYMAPEIVGRSEEGCDFSSDVWSVGVIM